MSTKPIKFIFLGNTITSKEIGYYSINGDDDLDTKSYINDANNMFEQFINKRGELEQKNKIKKSNGCYYHITYPNNIFYLVFAETNFNEGVIYDMIDFIHRQGICKMTERGKGLTKLAKDNLKNIMKDVINKKPDNMSTSGTTRDNSLLSQVQGEIDNVQIEMKENIKKALVNVDEVNTMSDKSLVIHDGSLMYRNLAADYRRKTWWNSKFFKFGMLAIGLIIVAIIIFWAFT